MRKKLTLSEQLRLNTNEYVKESKGETNNTKILKIKVLDTDVYNSQTVIDVRKQLDLTQSELSMVLGVSARTVESWEQGRSTPSGSAQRLLDVISEHPSTLKDIISVETVASSVHA